MPAIVISSVSLYQICSFQDCDVHFFAALLKNYLRELPVPLLGRKEGHVHDRWVEVPALPTKEARVKEIRYILKEDLPSNVVINIQYLVKMLAELVQAMALNKGVQDKTSDISGISCLNSCYQLYPHHQGMWPSFFVWKVSIVEVRLILGYFKSKIP